jgi:ribosome-associated translation inhibitor RaiA
MEYIIHQLELIEPPTQRSFFEDEVKKKVSRIEKVLRDYRKQVMLEIFLKKEGNLFVITASLALLQKILTVTEEGFKPVAVINFVFDRLKNLVANQLRLERKEHLYKRKNRLNDLAEYSNIYPIHTKNFP